jgi:hypothetical protein
MASIRQIAANRLNAEKSTGPTSSEGKRQSRGNALRHGLTGTGVVQPEDDAEAVEARMAEWRETFRPANDEEEWLFKQLVVDSVRIDRGFRLESDLRAYEARRASLAWEDDRRLDAEKTAAALPRRPALVVRRLRETAQGCDWLIERWRGLDQVLRSAGDWTAEQRALALDLLGTPAELRETVTWDSPSALVAREVADLERLQAEALNDLDAFERESAEQGCSLAPSPALLRLRRYEAACLRRYQWSRAQLTGRGRTDPPDVPVPAPALPAPVEPVVVPPPPDAPDRDFEAKVLRYALAQRASAVAAEPEPPAPADPPPAPEEPVAPVAVLLDAPTALPRNPTAPDHPRFLNRKMRRAAEKASAGAR